MKSFKLIKPYLVANRYRIIFGLWCLIIVDLLQLFIPRVIKRVVDDLTLMQVDRSGLLDYALTILALGLCIGFFRFFWRRCLLGTARKTEEALRNRLFAHIQTLSPAYFDRVRTGDLMAHATNDIQQVRMASGMGLVALNDALFLGSAAIGFMIYINLELTLYVLIPMPLIVMGTRFFSRPSRRNPGDHPHIRRLRARKYRSGQNHRCIFPADDDADQPEPGHRPVSGRPPDHLRPNHTW